MTDLLELGRLDAGLFRGVGGGTASYRAFGGHVAAQALTAAGRTVPGGRTAHSLHAYFLRPGDACAPIEHRVDDVRDGGSFSTRRVAATQGGAVILTLTASFQVPEAGVSHQVPVLDAPPPEELPVGAGPLTGGDPRAQRWYADLAGRHPVEIRFHGAPTRIALTRGERIPPRQRFWIRVTGALPDDPLLHCGSLAYVSDLLLLSSSLGPHRLATSARSLQFASLDHAVWFHAPFRADDWLFYDQESEWAGAGRALCRGRIFDRRGTLVASVMQEGLVRALGPGR
jgi:acyl-CoA thioesterase-2